MRRNLGNPDACLVVETDPAQHGLSGTGHFAYAKWRPSNSTARDRAVLNYFYKISQLSYALYALLRRNNYASPGAEHDYFACK